jgi:hypothetical protein
VSLVSIKISGSTRAFAIVRMAPTSEKASRTLPPIGEHGPSTFGTFIGFPTEVVLPKCFYRRRPHADLSRTNLKRRLQSLHQTFAFKLSRRLLHHKHPADPHQRTNSPRPPSFLSPSLSVMILFQYHLLNLGRQHSMFEIMGYRMKRLSTTRRKKSIETRTTIT